MLALAISLHIIGAVAASPSIENEGLLQDKRWRELAYGVSLRPPVDANLSTPTHDDALLHIDGYSRYAITFYLEHSNVPIDLDRMMQEMVFQPSWASGKAFVLDDLTRHSRPAGRPGAIIYLEIPRTGKTSQVLGQAVMQIDPTTFALLRLGVDQKYFEAARPVFEAVFNSFQVDPPRQLDEQREQLIAKGETWLRTINLAKVQANLINEQWFRITEQGKDVGYMVIRQNIAEEMGHTGVRVDVQAHVVGQNNTYDLMSNFFWAADDSTEFWSIKNTRRPQGDLKMANIRQKARSTADTGVRADQIIKIDGRDTVVNMITVKREMPISTVNRSKPLTDVHEYKWTRPPRAYGSLVLISLIGQLLPHEQPTEMAFYAYDPNVGKVVLRTERIEPTGNGNYLIHSRSSTESEEYLTKYDSNGSMIQRVYPDGRIINAANPKELLARWKIR